MVLLQNKLTEDKMENENENEMLEEVVEMVVAAEEEED